MSFRASAAVFCPAVIELFSGGIFGVLGFRVFRDGRLFAMAIVVVRQDDRLEPHAFVAFFNAEAKDEFVVQRAVRPAIPVCPEQGAFVVEVVFNPYVHGIGASILEHAVVSVAELQTVGP